MNNDAGRGNWIVVTLRLKDGQKVPAIVDTGSPVTCLDNSMEPELGKCLDSGTYWDFGVSNSMNVYTAPRLYLQNTPLKQTGSNIFSFDCKPLATNADRSIMGILGMDVLANYCIQLDFAARKVRFLDDARADKRDWGQPFPLTDLGDGCFTIGENLSGLKGAGSIVDTGCNYAGWLTPKLFRQWTNQASPPAVGEPRSPNAVLAGDKYQELDLESGPDALPSTGDTHIQFCGIGIRFLSEHLVTLDFPNRTMYLKRSSKWPLMDPNLETEVRSAANSSEKVVKALRHKRQLPGWSKHDSVQPGDADFHFRRDPGIESATWELKKNGDASVYHYTLTRTSKQTPWKLQKAWQTDDTGRVIENYPIP